MVKVRVAYLEFEILGHAVDLMRAVVSHNFFGSLCYQ